ncbi:transposase [Pontiella desulfatans]|uniref:transposase n=1 Tax=Pontiella desulfatans TaxID=2750659 RepID=UPI00109D2ACE|nr:transposase [Pontiella desulfatans]
MNNLKENSWFLQVVFILISRFFMPRYDARIQMLKYQIKMLRDRIDDPRVITTPEERAELMRLGALIGHEISDIMLVAKPDTYRGWLRKKAGKKPTRKGGRPETDAGTIKLIIRLASENLGWGYKRIFGELRKLGVTIGLTTIRDIMKRNNFHPVPDKSLKNPDSTWSRFISSHIETLVAIDFFTKPIYTLKGKFDAHVLVFIHLGSRRVFMSPATFHPDEKWVLQQARNAAMWLDDIGVKASHLIRDRDGKFPDSFDGFWECSGTEIVKTPPRTPQANDYASYCTSLEHWNLRFCLAALFRIASTFHFSGWWSSFSLYKYLSPPHARLSNWSEHFLIVV